MVGKLGKHWFITWLGSFMNIGVTDDWETTRIWGLQTVGKLHEYMCHRWLANQINMGLTDGWETSQMENQT